MISLFLVLQLQRLSDVGEESVIVTANISDDTTSVLGIDKFISCFTATETICCGGRICHSHGQYIR